MYGQSVERLVRLIGSGEPDRFSRKKCAGSCTTVRGLQRVSPNFGGEGGEGSSPEFKGVGMLERARRQRGGHIIMQPMPVLMSMQMHVNMWSVMMMMLIVTPMTVMLTWMMLTLLMLSLALALAMA